MKEKMGTTYVLDTEKTFHELETSSENKVNKSKLFKQLKYMEPILINRILKRFRDQGLSHADAKTNALASEEYERHLKGLLVAEIEYEQARDKYEHMKILKDMRITEESSARNLINKK
jgi:Zn-finger domain-containing protein